MSDNPETNSTASAVNTVISDVGQGIVSIVENLILVDFPFLALPIIKPIWEVIFQYIAGRFTEAAQDGATFAIIDHQVSSEETALTKALNNLIAAQKLGDDVAIQKAIQAYADAHSALIHSDGSALH